jgi:hypothetical protein
MFSLAFPRVISGILARPQWAVRSAILICCGLFLASISTPTWSRWISGLYTLREPKSQSVTRGETLSDVETRSSGDEDNTIPEYGNVASGNRGRSGWLNFLSLNPRWRRSQSRDKIHPPPAEFPIQILYDGPKATIE